MIINQKNISSPFQSHFIRQIIFLFLLGLMISSKAVQGQTTYLWDCGSASVVTSGSNPNITIGSWVQGNNNGTTTLITNVSTSSGYTGSSGINNFGAAARTGALVTGANGSAYFEISFTPAINYSLTLSNVSFGSRSTSTGPVSFSVRTNKDNYTSDIATASSLANSTWTLLTSTATGSAATSNLSSSITVRIYGYAGTGSASANTANWRIDDISIIVTASPSCTSPTTQTSNLTTNSPTTDGFSSSWTSGNGNGTMIAVRPVAQSIQAPSSGTAYSANVAWSAAGQIDVNNRVVFRGAGTSAGPITGLSPETPYAVTAYEYSNTGDCYNLTSPPSSSIFTLSLEPSGHSYFTNCASSTSSDITLSFNAIASIPLSNADGYIILQKQGITAPSSLPSDGTSYSIGNTIGDATVAAIINSTSVGAATISGLSSSTAYSFTLVPYNWNGANAQTYNYFTTGSVPATSCATSAPQPEINLQGNAIDIVNGLIIPSVINATDFGNVSWGSSITKTFTIQNIGSAGLNLTGTPIVQLSGSSVFSITTQPSATSIAAGNSLTFVVTFSPVSIGVLTATISIANNDGNENPYTFTIQGTGVANTSSDIIINPGFTYPTNIPYHNYQASNIINDANSIEVAQFTIRDGAASVDADNLGTILSQLVLNISNPSFIRRIALYDGTTEIGTEQAGASTVTFSGLNLTVSDGATKDFSVRVSFNTAVTDNQQIQITIAATTSASSSGSTFAATNAGGATSSITGDNNRVEVTADRLAFAQQPTNTTINGSMSPSVIISANDINANRDLDFVSTISLSSTGTLTGAPIIVTAVSGVSTFSSLTHTVAGTGFTISASTNSFSTIQSNTFDIVSYPTNSYRTTSSGIWPSVTATNWEQFNGSVWSPSSAPASNTPNNLYILHTITSNANFAATAPGTNMIIQNGGTFNDGHVSTFGSLLIQNGGIFNVTASITINATSGTLTIESGGRLNINSASISGTSPIWGGTENFKNGSIVDIQNWNYAAGSAANRLVQNPSIISTNSDGYYFGNLTISGSPTQLFVMVDGSQSINLCKNNFTSSSTGSNVAFTIAAANVTIGGNVIVSQGQLSIAATTTGNPVATILGNIEPTGGIINLNQGNSANATSVVQLKGNLSIPSGVTLFSTDAGCKIVFSGTTNQTLSIAGTLGTNVDMEVGDGTSTSFVSLINQHLNLVNSSNSISVMTNGTLDFNNFNTIGLGVFTLNTSGTLKITSINGVNISPSVVGNIQSTGTRTFSQSGYYHYTGSSSPQSTGTAMTSGSTAKRIIIEKTNTTDTVNLTQSTGITDKLEIIQGVFVETPTAVLNGSGNILMSGGEYRMSLLSTTLPQLSGSYTLTGGTITLNGSGDQILRGGKDYRNLTFSTSGTKILSSAPSSITGTITVANAAILDVENKTMGGSGTNLTMMGTSRYKTAGTGIKPDASGTYSLGSGTTIEFTNTAGSLEDIRRAAVNYYNIDISGSNVGNSTLTTPINMQSGATFTVKSAATFHLKNTSGFIGGSSTSISSTNNPTVSLETNSTIDYNGANQTVTNTMPYQHLFITGSGTKTSASSNDLNIVGNLQLDAELALANTDIYIGGNWNKSATGNFVANNKTVYFNGSNNSTLTAFNGQYFPKLTLTKTNSNITLSLIDQMSIGKSLTVTSGTLDLASKDITLLSNDTSTASFGKVGSNGIVTYGNGRFVVERYIPTGTGSGQHPKSWQFLAVPNNGVQTINQAWQDTSVTANENRYAGYGTQITGPGGIANGFDLATSAPSMKTYNSLSNTWDGIPNTTSTPIYNAKGYMVFVRGDRSVINFNSAGCNNCIPVPTILRTRGKLFVPNSNPPAVINNIPANSFESIGNPYASAIDFSNLIRGGSVDAAFYVWDPLMNGSYNLGAYRTYTNADLLGAYSGYKIQSGQAFFVHTTGGTGSISFNEDVKVSGSAMTNRPPVISPNRQFLRIKLFADTIATKLADIATAVFDPVFSNNYDRNDAFKLINGGENLGLICQNKILAQEARYKIALNDTLFLTLRNCRMQGYQFQFTPTNMDHNSLTPVLIDRFLWTTQEISNIVTSNFKFLINTTPASYASDRFIIVFKKKKTLISSKMMSTRSAVGNIKPSIAVGKIAIKPNPVRNGNINIHFDNMPVGNYTAKLLNINGQILQQEALKTTSPSENKIIILDKIPKGVYQIQLISENGQQYTEQILLE